MVVDVAAERFRADAGGVEQLRRMQRVACNNDRAGLDNEGFLRAGAGKFNPVT